MCDNEQEISEIICTTSASEQIEELFPMIAPILTSRAEIHARERADAKDL